MAKRRDIEGPIHRSVVAYLRHTLPGAVIHSAANESHLSGRAAMMATVRKKSNGMLVGFPDIICLFKGRAFGIEVKAGIGRQTPAQKVVQASFEANDIPYAVVRSIEDVEAFLGEVFQGAKFVEIRGIVS